MAVPALPRLEHVRRGADCAGAGRNRGGSLAGPRPPRRGRPGERQQNVIDLTLGLGKVVGVCSGISYTYRDYVPAPSGVAALPGPAVGDRAPDVDFEGGGALFDATRHTGFTLLLLPGSRRAHGARLQVELSDAALERVQRRFPSVVRAQRLPASPALERAYGNVLDDRLLLIRPDGYIGFHCLAGEVARLETHLGQLIV